MARAVFLLLLGIVFLGACANTRKQANVEAGLAALSAPEFFAAVEERLMDEMLLSVRYVIRSEGEFKADFTGTLHFGKDGVADLNAKGNFGDDPMQLALKFDGHTMTGGNGERTFSSEEPPALREALVIGLTRMGLLHNLARLTAGAPPDRADGGVREFVEVRDIVDSEAAPVVANARVLSLSIYVSDTNVADATLHADARTALPIRREQTVRFPGGSMTVVEEYEFVGSP